MQKLYIVRSYIPATSIKQAIALSKKREPDEVWIADEWMKEIGFIERQGTAQTDGFVNKSK